MNIQVLLDGQDLTAAGAVHLPSLVVESTLAQGSGVPTGTSGRAATCTFLSTAGPMLSAIGAGQTVPPGPPSLVRQGEVIVTDTLSGTKLFGGYATKLTDRTTKMRVYTQVDCVDYWQDLDRVIVNQVYDTVADTYIVANLLATYAPWIVTTGVDLTTNHYTFPRIYFRGKTLQYALQRVADTTGYDIWVDAAKQLHYINPALEGNAPFALSDTPDYLSSFPCEMTKHELDDNAIINRVFFFGGSTLGSDFTQDISWQANGSNTVFQLAYRPEHASDGKFHVTVGGVAQAVGEVSLGGAANTLKSAGGTADVLVDADNATLTFNVAPASGASVTVKYRYRTPLAVVSTNAGSYNFFGRYFDGHIDDTTVLDTTTALQRCRVLLAEQAYGLEQFTVRFTQPGLVAGTRLQVDNNVRNVHGLYKVQRVKMSVYGGGQFQFEADLGAWDWSLMDLLLSAARLLQTDDQNYNEAETPIQVQSTGTTLMTAHISLATVTHTSGAYYARATAVGDGHDAYPGAFTITQ